MLIAIINKNYIAVSVKLLTFIHSIVISYQRWHSALLLFSYQDEADPSE